MSRRMRPSASGNPRYQAFYLKKLQTQTSISSEFSNELQQTSRIIQREIEKIEKGLYKRNAQFTKTLRRKSQIQDEQQRSRTDLKSRIEQKMRKSHHNMLQYRQKSNSSLSNRIKAEHQKIQQIKRLQKTVYNQNCQKAHQISLKTQKFFEELQQKKRKRSQQISIHTSTLISHRKGQPIFSPISKKHFKHRQTSHEKSHHKQEQNPQNSNGKTPKISLLRTPRESILEKQKKKSQLEKSKEDSFIQGYVKKLQCIQASRKKVKFDKKVPQSTVAKFIDRQIGEQQIQARRKFNRSFVQQAVNNKNSFSQVYRRKLQQKKDKKEFFLSQSIVHGDLLLKQDLMQTSKFKLNKLIRETQNELARKQNFRYMEKYLTKKF